MSASASKVKNRLALLIKATGAGAGALALHGPHPAAAVVAVGATGLEVVLDVMGGAFNRRKDRRALRFLDYCARVVNAADDPSLLTEMLREDIEGVDRSDVLDALRIATEAAECVLPVLAVWLAMKKSDDGLTDEVFRGFMEVAVTLNEKSLADLGVLFSPEMLAQRTSDGLEVGITILYGPSGCRVGPWHNRNPQAECQSAGRLLRTLDRADLAQSNGSTIPLVAGGEQLLQTDVRFNADVADSICKCLALASAIRMTSAASS